MSEIIKAKKAGLVYAQTSSDSYTHVILEKEKYDHDQKTINNLFRAVQSQDDELKQIKQDFNIATIRNNRLYKEISTLNDQLQQLQEAINNKDDVVANLNRVNNNLARQIKERNNADLEQRPKKSHTGYSLVSMIPIEHRFKVDYDFIKLKCFESIFQTPYKLELNYSDVIITVKNDFNGDSERNILKSLNADYVAYDETIEEVHKRIKSNKSNEEQMICFNFRIKANGRSKYWEIVFNHTLPFESIAKVIQFNRKTKGE